MKRKYALLFVTVALCLIGWIPAITGNQGELMLTLNVKDNQGRGLRDTEVEFIETKTRQRIKAKTDGSGVLKYHFKTGRYWQINIRDVRNYFFWQFEVRPGKRMNLSKTITYDYKHYERETRPAVDRTKLRLKTVPQKISFSDKPDQQFGIVKLQIQKGDKSPLTRFPIALTCYKQRTTYTTETNPAGIALFKVPLDHEYEIDIDGIYSFSYVDLPDRPGYRGHKRFTYEPTVITEKVLNDTITQQLDPKQKGTSGSVLTRITFKGGPDGIWRNEPVYLEVLGQQKWYRGTTNQYGEARFLLPKGQRYMIHGRFEYDLDALDFTRRRGIGYSNKSVIYRPRDKYQFPDKYIPKPQDLIVSAFQDYLKKAYPAPAPGELIAPHAQWDAPVNAQTKEAVLRLAFTATDEADPSAAPPMNICFVIDKSGSMWGHDRLDNLKHSLISFIQRMRAVDYVSLVIFESFETAVFPSQQLGDDRSRLVELIQRLEADGGTNIFKGLVAGYKEVAKNLRSGRTNRVILLSDGYGVTPIEDILKAQEPFTAKGIECSTVGVGQDYNYALLKQLATRGGGLIEHVGDAKGMQEAFLRQLSSILLPVAKNVEVEVVYNKHLRYKQLYGFPLKEKGTHRLKLKLKNLYSGLSLLAFLRFEVVDAGPEITSAPVTIRLKYQDLRTNAIARKEIQAPLEWKASGGADLASAFDQEEKRLYAIAVMNQSLKVMSEAFHKGDVGAAKTAVKDGLRQLQEKGPQPPTEELKELQAQLEGYLDILARQ